MKRRWLALTALLSVASCNQAPDDDTRSVNTPRAVDAERVRQGNRSLADAPPAVKYELQGAPGGTRPFPSRQGCEVSRKAMTEAQAKADNQRSEHGVLLPSRPMLACVPI